MNGNLLKILKEKTAVFSKRQRQISEFIAENYESAAFMTAERLAEATGVSESTVVRFACELGYNGYPGLRREMQELLRQKMSTESKNGKLHEIDFEECFSTQIEKDIVSINSMSDSENKMAFVKCMELLLNAKKIFLCADSSVITLSAHVATMLRVLHTNAEIACINEEYSRLLVGDSECVVLYFSIGNLYEKMPVTLRMARDGGAKIITVTGRSDLPAGLYADVRIIAPSCSAMVTVAYAIVSGFEKALNTTLEDNVREIEHKRREYNGEKD